MATAALENFHQHEMATHRSTAALHAVLARSRALGSAKDSEYTALLIENHHLASDSGEQQPTSYTAQRPGSESLSSPQSSANTEMAVDVDVDVMAQPAGGEEVSAPSQPATRINNDPGKRDVLHTQRRRHERYRRNSKLSRTLANDGRRYDPERNSRTIVRNRADICQPHQHAMLQSRRPSASSPAVTIEVKILSLSQGISMLLVTGQGCSIPIRYSGAIATAVEHALGCSVTVHDAFVKPLGEGSWCFTGFLCEKDDIPGSGGTNASQLRGISGPQGPSVPKHHARKLRSLRRKEHGRAASSGSAASNESIMKCWEVYGPQTF